MRIYLGEMKPSGRRLIYIERLETDNPRRLHEGLGFFSLWGGCDVHTFRRIDSTDVEFWGYELPKDLATAIFNTLLERFDFTVLEESQATLNSAR